MNRKIFVYDLACRGAIVACTLARSGVKLFSEMIQDQRASTIGIVETKLIDGIEGLPLAILLQVIDIGILVDLRNPFLYINIVVVWRES